MVILDMLPDDEAPIVLPIAKMDPRSRIKAVIKELGAFKDDRGLRIPLVPYVVSCAPVVLSNRSKQPELVVDPVA